MVSVVILWLCIQCSWSIVYNPMTRSMSVPFHAILHHSDHSFYSGMFYECGLSCVVIAKLRDYERSRHYFKKAYGLSNSLGEFRSTFMVGIHVCDTSLLCHRLCLNAMDDPECEWSVQYTDPILILIHVHRQCQSTQPGFSVFSYRNDIYCSVFIDQVLALFGIISSNIIEWLTYCSRFYTNPTMFVQYDITPFTNHSVCVEKLLG